MSGFKSQPLTISPVGYVESTIPLGASVTCGGHTWDTGNALGVSLLASVWSDQPGILTLLQSANGENWVTLGWQITVAYAVINIVAPITMQYAQAVFYNSSSSAQTVFQFVTGMVPLQVPL